MPKPRVLVVDDEPLIREFVMEALIEAGYDVDEAGHANDAKALLDVSGYQLLVTDVNMPGQIDGIALAKFAQTHNPALAVIVISARPDLVPSFRTTGVTGAFLRKPFALAELLQLAALYVDPTPQ
jgi:DNA-binding response OmpR family regulator